jgi:hypothetical protein
MESDKRARFCWLRLRRHRWRRTGAFQLGPGAFNRGNVLRCRECGHETATVSPLLLERAASDERQRDGTT